MRMVFLAAALAMASCSPTMKMSNSAGGLLEYGNRYSRAEALAMAEAHCKQFGKVARVTSQDTDFTYTTSFECVAPG